MRILSPKTEDPRTKDPQTKNQLSSIPGPRFLNPRTEDPQIEDPRIKDPRIEDPVHGLEFCRVSFHKPQNFDEYTQCWKNAERKKNGVQGVKGLPK